MSSSDLTRIQRWQTEAETLAAEAKAPIAPPNHKRLLLAVAADELERMYKENPNLLWMLEARSAVLQVLLEELLAEAKR